MGALPLSPAQAKDLWAALAERPEHEVDDSRLVERLAMRLVEVLDAEEASPDGLHASKRARRRARRFGGALGLAGFAAQPLIELVEVVEEARLARDVARERMPGRNARDRAADLLVLWGLADDVAVGRAALDGDGPTIVEQLVGRAKGQVTNPRSVRGAISLVRETYDELAGGRGGLRSVPIVASPIHAWESSREMKEWATRVAAHYEALA